MSEAILTGALIVSVALNVLSAVLISRTSVKQLETLDRAHERTTRHTEGLVERLMAMDFQTYKAYEMLAEAPEVNDQPEPEIPQFVDGPDKGGFASKFGLRALTLRHESTEAEHVRATEELLESELPR